MTAPGSITGSAPGSTERSAPGSTAPGSTAPGSTAPGSTAPGSTAPVPSIEFEAVSFCYPDGTRALSDVGLRIGPGESVAIVGQNGSGKSTLVRHLNGLLRPTGGRVLLDGRDVRPIHVARLAGLVGLAFQNPDRQLFAGRVLAEVAFGPRNLGIRGRELDERVRVALEDVGLAAEASINPYDLGYSRRKLLALASVLAMRTPILVLDEPTTGQDARGVARVREVVARAAGEGRTVIAISHDMRFVAESFRRVVVMREGRVVLDGAPDVVFAETAWGELRAAHLEPPLPAVAGARLGLGSTPTDAAFVAALAAGGAPRAGRGRAGARGRWIAE
jgi:energy-coupling factor transport system ATP-binding protein